jgi:aspartate carbamoyltransferase catalytic subunit
MSITDRSTTGIAKGECLSDIAEMFNNYGDCVVLRDNNETSLEEMIDSLRIPIINAGNGADEHPTQALSDMYAIFKWRPDLVTEEAEKAPIKVGIIGVPNKMRTVRSFIKCLTKFPKAIDELVIIHDEASTEQLFGSEQKEQVEQAGIKIRSTRELDEVLPELDVVYINAISWEGNSVNTYGSEFHLSAKSPLKESAIILHPLARGEELSTDLDHTPHNWYFSQARGAVFLRMALLTCMVQRAERVIDVV